MTREGRQVSCLDMVEALVRRAEDADDRLMIRQEELRKDQQSQGVRLRRKTLLTELRKVQGVAEKQGLKEPTMPAVQRVCVSQDTCPVGFGDSDKLPASRVPEHPGNSLKTLSGHRAAWAVSGRTGLPLGGDGESCG